MLKKDLEPLYTAEEIACIMRLDYETALTLIKFMPHLEIEGNYRIHVGDIEEFLYNAMVFPGMDRKHFMRCFIEDVITLTRDEQMVTLQELANYLNVDYSSALKVMQNNIPHIQVDGHYRMCPSDVNNYLSTNQT